MPVEFLDEATPGVDFVDDALAPTTGVEFLDDDVPAAPPRPLLSELYPRMDEVAAEWGVKFVKPGDSGLNASEADTLNRTMTGMVRREAESRISGGRTGDVLRGLQHAGVDVARAALDPLTIGLAAASVIAPPVAPAALMVFGASQAGAAAGSAAGGAPLQQVVQESTVAGLTVAGAGAKGIRAPVVEALQGVRAVAPATAAALRTVVETPPAPKPSLVAESVTPPDALTTVTALPDESRISSAIRTQDVMPGRDWIASPEFEFRKNPLAKRLVTDTVEAELSYRSQVGRDIERFDGIKASLTPDEQTTVTSALRSAQKGDVAPLDALPDVLKATAREVRTYFEDVRQVIVAEKRQSLVESLPGPRQAAMEDILAGADRDTAFRAHKLRRAGKADVESALAEFDDLKTWGPADYVTNIERGSYRVVDPDGTTVAIAETRAAAKTKALDYLRENPDVTNLTLDDSFNASVEFPTKLSRGQYYRMLSRMSEALETDAKAVETMLRAEGRVVTVKPTAKYAAPLQQRHGVLKGEENLFDVLPSYAYSVRKKLALDPVLKQARTVLPSLPDNVRPQVEELLNDVKGRKTLSDRVVDHILAPLGTKPFGFSRGVSVLRSATTLLKLGYRPVTAIINRASGLQHTWTQFGTHWLTEGRRFQGTPEFGPLWEVNRDRVGAEASMALDAAPAAQNPLHPLSMFQWAEKVNRPEAFATAYRYAADGLKLAPDKAAAFARDQTRLTQFVYNTSSLPRAMRGPVGRLVFQFKPYLVKELEFVSTLRGAAAARHLTGFLALGGPRALIYMLRSLPVIGAIGLLREAEDGLNEHAPAASRGVGGALGVDVTAAVTPQFPSRVEDWLGPSLADVFRLGRDVIAPALRGESRDFTDVAAWGARLAPSLFYWSQLVESAQNEGGWINDDRDRPTYRPDIADKVKMAFGAKPLDQSVQEVERRYLKETDEILRRNRARLIDDLLDAATAKDGAAIQRLTKDAAEYGVTASMVRNAAKQRALPFDERLWQGLSKRLRQEEEAERR